MNCPSCNYRTTGTENYCAQCGVHLTAQVLIAESRRVVSVIFCDLVGSTSLSERLDPEALRGHLLRYYQVTKQALERGGGTVEKFIGDAVMGVFGLRDTHEDDALHAVRAAMAMRDAVHQLAVETRDSLDLKLAVRIGIHTGEVVAFPPGQDVLISGEAVNVAARLQQAARPDQILIGAATRALVQGAVRMEPVPSLSLKGISTPVAAWIVHDARGDVTGIPRHMSTPFVGREPEMTYLHNNLDHVRHEGRGHLFTVLGEPGIGKSRLVREFVRSLGPGTTAVSGRCRPFSESAALDPLIDMLGILRGSSGTGRDEQFRTLSELSDGDLELSLSETALAVRRVLEDAASGAPLVVVLDDIQWAKPGLLDVIEQLADGIGATPVMLLCVARLDLLDHRSTWAGGKLSSSSMLLMSLSARHTEELARHYCDVTLHDAGGDLAVLLAERSGGNPLFVEQLFAAIQDGAVINTLPVTIRALIAARLQQLETDETRVLQCAAMVGQEFSEEVLRALLPQVGLGVVLQNLTWRQLIEETGSGGGYRFCSVQIREAARDETPKLLRAEMHERIGGYLLKRNGDAMAEQTAGHLEQALKYYAELGQAARAASIQPRVVALLRRAARRAFAHGDLHSVVDLLDRVLEVSADDGPARITTLTMLGDALIDTGQSERAAQTFQEMMGEAERAGDSSALAHATLGLSRLAAGGQGHEDLLTLSSDAVRIFAESHDDRGLARAWLRTAQAHQADGRYAEAAAAFGHSLTAGGHTGSVMDHARAVGGLALSLLRGPVPAPVALLRCDALITALPPAKRLARIAVICPQAALLATQRRFAEAEVLITEAQALGRELRHEFIRSVVPVYAASTRMLAGDFAAAETELRDACAMMRKLDDSLGLAAAGGDLVRVYLELGQMDLAIQTMRMGTGWPAEESLPAGWTGAQARLLLELGDPDAAVSSVQAAFQAAFRTDSPEIQATALMDRAHVRGVTGDGRAALEDAAAALARYEAKEHLVGISRATALLAELTREQAS